MPVVLIWEVSLGCILSLSQKKKKVNNTKNIAVKQVTVFLGLHVCRTTLCMSYDNNSSVHVLIYLVPQY